MKQIIPFEKELLLHTKINDVTSISLEHTLKLGDDNIKGEFIITGDYKITATSINREKFKFNLPVEIDIDNNYDYENAIIDIDNFYYEIVNDDSIKVNIDVYIDAEVINKKEVIIEDEEMINEDIDNNKNDRLDINIDSNIDIDVNNNSNNNSNNNIEEDIKDEEMEEAISYNKPDKIDIDDNVEDKNVNFLNTDDFSNDTYATYYVYIVKEDDTIDKVTDKFKITKEDLSSFNDISNIKKGDKLIIPVVDE